MKTRSPKGLLLLALSFAVAMIVSFSDAKCVFAEETERTATNEYTVSDTINAVLYSDGALEITGEGSLGETWSGTGSVPWYSQRASITSVVISDKITSLGNYAFYGCTSLTQTSLPDAITSVGNYAFYNCKSLTGITLPTGLTSIGSYAFQSCTSLAQIALPTGITTVEQKTFCGCTELAAVTLPEGLTEIKNYAFQNCFALTEIRIPATVTTINSNSFSGCSELTKVTFGYGMETIPSNACSNMTALTDVVYETGSDGEATKITSVGSSAFYNCSSLTQITLPEGLTTINSYTFQSCTSLAEITLPEALGTVGYRAFYGCTSLDYFEIKGELTSIGSQAFYVGTELETMVSGEMTDALTQYDWEGSNRNLATSEKTFTAGENITATLFTNGLMAFRGSGAMSSWTADSVPWKDSLDEISVIDIGDGITAVGSYAVAGSSVFAVSLGDDIVSVGESAFASCKNLRNIEIGSGLTEIGTDAFQADASTLTVLTTENSVAQAYDWEGDNRTLVTDGVSYSLGKRMDAYVIGTTLYVTGFGTIPDYSSSSVPWKSVELTAVVIGDGIRGIGNYSFYGQDSLQKITIGDRVSEIGNYAFYNCAALKSVSLPEALSDMGTYCFYGCSSLADINFNETKITEIGQWCFYNCTSLKRIVISSGIESIGANAFKDCSSVNTLRMEEGVTEISANAFYGCSKITSVKIPRSVKTAERSSGKGPFGGCENLTEVTFADKARSIPANLLAGVTGITSVELPETVSQIGTYAFYGCTGLQSVTLPTSAGEIGDYAFYGCSALTSVSFNDYLQEIGASAFRECTALTSAALPDSVETIGAYAFYNDSQLASVVLGSGIESIPNYCFYGVAAEEFVLRYKVASIGNYAFANNDTLVRITIPGNTTSIASSAFDQATMTVYGEAGSQAQTMAEEKGYTFVAGTSIESLALDEQSVTLALSEKSELTATFSPETMTNAFAWSSGDTSVATVTVSSDPAKAVVKGVSAGETDITVTVGEKTASCHVTVENRITSLKLNTTYKQFTSKTQTLQLKATRQPSSAEEETLVWSSSDSSVAEVDENGLVTPKSNGTARIIVATEDGRVSAYCFVSVEMEILAEGIEVTPTELLLTAKARQLTAKITPSNATDQEVTWTSSDTSVATVDETGLVSPVAAGTAVVTAATSDGNYTASCEVTVKEVAVPVEEIVLPQEELELSEVGQTAEIGASVSPTDADIQTLIYSSSDPEIVSVDEDGIVTAIGGGTAVITIETEDGTVEAQCEVTVNRLIRSMEVSPGSLSLAIGEQQIVRAVIQPSDALEQDVRWYSTNRKVATVDEDGLVTAVGAGTAYIKCQAQDESGQSASCQVTVTDPNQTAGSDQTKTEDSAGTATQDAQTGAAAQNNGQSEAAKTEAADVTVKKSKITKLSVKKKKLTVKWKKVKANGYQIQISKKKSFSKLAWKKTVSSSAKTKLTVKNLKKGTYYIRLRVRKKQNGKWYYSSWSAKKKFKIS